MNATLVGYGLIADNVIDGNTIAEFVSDEDA